MNIILSKKRNVIYLLPQRESNPPITICLPGSYMLCHIVPHAMAFEASLKNNNSTMPHGMMDE